MKRAPAKKPKPPRPAKKLEAWQRVLFKAVTRPLAPGFRTQAKWVDGQPSKKVFARLVKPSATLQPFDRIEIYNRMYWFRMLDGLAEDFPGLRRFLGHRRFDALCVAYMIAYPSKSYTLRNVGARLRRFLQKLPAGKLPEKAAALDLVSYEWAQVEAFDGEARPRLDPAKLTARARVGLQPYLTLLRVKHPVEDFVSAVKSDGVLKTGASNTVTARHTTRAARNKWLPEVRAYDLAVHRYENRLYFKRLEPRAARLLRALRNGKTLEHACASAMQGCKEAPESQAQQLREWFSSWTGLGWLCTPA